MQPALDDFNWINLELGQVNELYKIIRKKVEAGEDPAVVLMLDNTEIGAVTTFFPKEKRIWFHFLITPKRHPVYPEWTDISWYFPHILKPLYANSVSQSGARCAPYRCVKTGGFYDPGWGEQVEMKNQFWISIVYISLLVFLSSCSAVKERQVLATPTMSCETSLDWKGIIPGKSSRSEVINKLGQPLESGTVKYADGEYKALSYPIDKGVVKDFIKADRIFFTADGIVSWIETAVGDRDGQLHEVKETSTHLGNDLDSIFANINFKPTSKTTPNGWSDILGGPDQIYVWSHCGLAIIALPGCHPDSSGQIVCSTETLATQEPSNSLSTINEPPYNIGGQVSTDPNSIILYQYYFPPTSYQDFKEYILNKTAYFGWGYWDKFIYEYNSTSK